MESVHVEIPISNWLYPIIIFLNFPTPAFQLPRFLLDFIYGICPSFIKTLK